jgi:hypothetical protein
MPRPRPNFQQFKLQYLNGIDNYEPIDENNFFVNTWIIFHCQTVKEHTYKLRVADIRDGKVDVKQCLHCKIAEKYAEQGIPRKVLTDWAEKNNLTLITEKQAFSRWTDVAEFECKICKEHVEYKALKYFETTTQFKEYFCEGCNKVKPVEIIPINMEQKLEDVSKQLEIVLEPVLKPVIDSEVAKKFIENNWHVIEYNGNRTKGRFQCKSCGYIKHCPPSYLFRRGKKSCRGCQNNKFSKQNNIKIVDVCVSNNVNLIGDFYENALTPLEFQCKECGNFIERTWKQVMQNDYIISCDCSKKFGDSQKEVAEYLKTIYNKEILLNNRTAIFPLELDIFLPEDKIGIEYCGLIWHSTRFQKDTSYHQRKLEMCLKNGIRLITIFEDEWIIKRAIVESRLKNMLGSSKVIYARECEVIEINTKTALDFCEENHIQGKGHCSLAYGLYNNNKLVSVMTFNEPSMSKGGTALLYDLELTRFCSLLDITVTGGANKLFSHFLRNNTQKKILSFCDLRWGTGNVYEKMGFKFIERLRPNYYYFGKPTNNKRVHRSTFMKHRLIERFGGLESETEEEIATRNGLYRIYDCGHNKYIFERL